MDKELVWPKDLVAKGDDNRDLPPVLDTTVS